MKRVKLKHPFIMTEALRRLLQKIDEAGGQGLLVGGCVRDHLLGHMAKDIDIEVYGLKRPQLESLLEEEFSVVAVGKSFGIFKVGVKIGDNTQHFDVAMPRRENKQGFGHKGFLVVTDPDMPFEEASLRRDFTINAMGIDVKTQELLDPHDGAKDLNEHRLRHVSLAFKEDPLRVLRAAQFCARFLLAIDGHTLDLCRELRDELKTLSKERIFEEMKKLLLAKKPSLGLEVLRETEALVLFPELAALIGCEQDPLWHPEGDVWIHSLMVTDQAAAIVREARIDEEERLIVITGALCHDLGKPMTTFFKDGRVKSPGHEQAGVVPTERFLDSIGFPKKLYHLVTALVKDHLKPYQLYRNRDEVTDGAIRRLSSRVDIDQLLMVSKADFLGRTTEEALLGHDPSGPWLKDKVLKLLGGDRAPKAILKGRHLIQCGQSPGPHFQEILREAFEAQLDGAFSDEESAIAWLRNRLSRPG